MHGVHIGQVRTKFSPVEVHIYRTYVTQVLPQSGEIMTLELKAERHLHVSPAQSGLVTLYFTVDLYSEIPEVLMRIGKLSKLRMQAGGRDYQKHGGWTLQNAYQGLFDCWW